LSSYIFTSCRLGFREWSTTDLDAMAEICADKEVMEHFPSTLSKDQTAEFITKRQQIFAENGFCYYAVEIIETKELIGFIGIEKQEYNARIEEPFIDIGWRLKKSTWNKGYATEGAKRCLEYAFETLKIPTIYSIATEGNVKSMYMMEKIGMRRLHNFEHPLLSDFPDFQTCIAYEIENKHL
jgi:RimJ/RimL family protein N-acetyltransferase